MSPRFRPEFRGIRTAVASALLVTAAVRAAEPVPAPPPLPAPAETLALLERVADWQLANPSRHKPTDWTQAAGYTGFMALAEISGSPRFLAAMEAMAERNAWQLGARLYHADDHCVAQTYVDLFRLKRDPARLAPTIAAFDAILAAPKAPDLSFAPTKKDRTDTWSWCDALFMAPPAWLKLHRETGKAAYLDFMIEHWWRTSDYLYDKEEHLYFRDDTYFAKREANGRKIFWSRGNGWVMGGLVRVLAELPADHAAYGRFLRQYREMAAKVATLQQPDGLWRSSLLDPASYPKREASGSGFYTYALAWGVNRGLLDRATFEPVVRRGWAGLVACVDSDGKLTHVQPIGSDPKTFDDGATEIYGVGAFLLAGREVHRLAGGSR